MGRSVSESIDGRRFWPKTKLFFAVLAIGLLAGCAHLPAGRNESARDRGELFAAIKVTDTAFSGPPKGDTGYFFYVDPDGGLTGYWLKNGEVRDVFGGSSDSAATIRSVDAIGLEPFDFAKEVQTVDAQLDREAAARGEKRMIAFVVDGAEYDIAVRTAKGTFHLRKWNPGFDIERLAPHSPKIAKLKAVLDRLAEYFGRTKFGV